MNNNISEDILFAKGDLFNLVIENLPDQIYLKDAQSRFVICNTPVAANAGFKTPAELIGKTDFDCHPQEAAQFFEDEQLLMKTDKSLINHEEYFVDNETGETRWNLSTKVPIKNKVGRVVGLLGINRDITQMKAALFEREEIMRSLVQRNDDLEKLTAQLSEKSAELNQQAADLQQLNQELTRQKDYELEKAIAQGKFEIASEVLHDIGNALVGFGAYLNRINRVNDKRHLDAAQNLNRFIRSQQDVLENTIGKEKFKALITVTDGIENNQLENNKEITTSVNELVNIITHIQEILSIQRQFVATRDESRSRKPVNLVNIIADCKAMLQASFEKHGIIFQIDIKPGNYIIKGDQTKLVQVLLNVLKNSLEAIPFEAIEKKVSVSLAMIGGFIELKMLDNGKGFNQETKNRFFERGFTTKLNGTGLGLYNCKSIIESHAGTFEIASTGVGAGACTIVVFKQDVLF
ncbi:PAS domain-containing sensor histidine kinase [Mucilaginibacter sp. UYCu711]|uniref:PAS domain-containing sensor histidine kinase n=1 Tax=Mucilaginibacter sp. UYCu711 TaxID=3156339 RepID=UPI003D23191C